MEAVCVPPHLVPPGSPQARQLWHFHVQPSLGQSCHRQKKKKKKDSRLYTRGHFGRVQLFVTLWTVAYQASLSGGSPGKNTGSVLANTGPSRALDFLLPYHQLPEYLVMPEPLCLKLLHHLHTWPSLGQTQVFQGSIRSKPQ